MFMLAVSCCCSHSFAGNWERAIAISMLSSLKPLRDDLVLPLPPTPGVVQSVAIAVGPDSQSMSPVPDRDSVPQTSAMLAYGPERVAVIEPSTQSGRLPPMSVVTMPAGVVT